MSQHIVHWDDLDSHHGEAGSISSHWSNLGRAAGSVRVRANRIRVDPGKRSTPLHAESDEEIFFILRGSGLAWQREDDSDTDATYEVRAGDCLVHLVDAEAHTLVAGEDGIDALAFGVGPEWTYAYFPRLKVIRVAHAIVDVDGRHQWPMEAELPEPNLPEPSPRPGRIVNVDEVEPEQWGRGDVSIETWDLGVAAGSVITGINYNRVAPGKLSAPPHTHSVEEEFFVILEGEGVCILDDDEYPVRPGHVVSRPASSRVAHAFRAGDAGLAMLAYGTRDPNDIVYYPRSDKIYFRGVGLMTRVPRLDYWDGEQD